MAFLTLFGLLTIFMGGSVIFDLFGIRAIEGNYVLFVVWANFICGFLYVISAYGLLKNIRWAAPLLGLAFIILLAAFAGLLIHIYNGGIYEKKTVGAMTFRTIITLLLYFGARYALKKEKPVKSKIP